MFYCRFVFVAVFLCFVIHGFCVRCMSEILIGCICCDDVKLYFYFSGVFEGWCFSVWGECVTYLLVILVLVSYCFRIL